MMMSYGRFFKRGVDAAIALGGLFVFCLPMAWIAFRIRREMGPPVIFRQTRVGRRKRPFTVLKFRTMNEHGVITSPFCQGLRARAMDELPQLVNILRGDMSFVGPRPLIPEELETLDRLPRGAERLSVRPGLTGLAQLRSAKVPDLDERLRWDLAYVDRCSFLMDMSILFRSVAVTLRGAWEKPGSKFPPERA